MRVCLDKGAYAPERAHTIDAGLDLKSKETRLIKALDSAVFDTGVHVEIPHGHFGLIASKSGLNTMYNITSTGVIDEGYTGSIQVKLYNHGRNAYMVHKGDKISQLIILPCKYEDVEIVDSLPETERGSNGFGSTGK